VCAAANVAFPECNASANLVGETVMMSVVGFILYSQWKCEAFKES